MKRYAFIDVQNTDTTTRKVLGFEIDWSKMYLYLKEKWNCEEIYFYSGIENGNSETAFEHQRLSELGYVVRAKSYSVYKNPDEVIKIICPECGLEIVHKIHKGGKWKSNCDVELAVDATNLINESEQDTEFLFFTGDGDFEYLASAAVEKGINVYIISSALRQRKGLRYFTSRFSSKLRNLISEKAESVFFIEINDWKKIIQKDS